MLLCTGWNGTRGKNWPLRRRRTRTPWPRRSGTGRPICRPRPCTRSRDGPSGRDERRRMGRRDRLATRPCWLIGSRCRRPGPWCSAGPKTSCSTADGRPRPTLTCPARWRGTPARRSSRWPDASQNGSILTTRRPTKCRTGSDSADAYYVSSQYFVVSSVFEKLEFLSQDSRMLTGRPLHNLRFWFNIRNMSHILCNVRVVYRNIIIRVIIIYYVLFPT